MTDKDVQQEVEENNQRQAENEAGDDSVVDTVDRVINPIFDAITRDPADSEDVADQRRLNDAEQRPE